MITWWIQCLCPSISSHHPPDVLHRLFFFPLVLVQSLKEFLPLQTTRSPLPNYPVRFFNVTYVITPIAIYGMNGYRSDLLDGIDCTALVPFIPIFNNRSHQRTSAKDIVVILNSIAIVAEQENKTQAYHQRTAFPRRAHHFRDAIHGNEWFYGRTVCHCVQFDHIFPIT